MRPSASFVLLILACGSLGAADPAGDAPPSPAEIQRAQILALPEEAATTALRDRLAHATPADAGRLLMDLGLSGRVAARPLIAEQLSRNDATIIERALRSLALLGVRGADQRARVVAQLGHAEANVRVQAIACLATIDDLRISPLLIERLKDPVPVVAEAALTALRRISGRAELATDVTLWTEWYQPQQEASDARFEALTVRLRSADPKEVSAAIESLALMQGESARAVDLVEPLVRDEDPKVVFIARQALARLAPGDFQPPSAQEKETALAPVSVPVPIAVGGLQRLLPGNGIFDTWMGLVIAAVGASGALAATVFLLRTPTVRNATKRFVKGVVSGTGRIMKPVGRIITTSTGRIFRPLTSRLRKMTDRIAKNAGSAKAGAGKPSAKA